MVKSAKNGWIKLSEVKTQIRTISGKNAETCEFRSRAFLTVSDLRAMCRSISKKLRELGFGDELDYLRHLAQEMLYSGPPPTIHLFHEHPDVKIPKLLTDRSEYMRLD